jgi:hypothetical protein
MAPTVSQARVVVVVASQEEVNCHWRRMANLATMLVQFRCDEEMGLD